MPRRSTTSTYRWAALPLALLGLGLADAPVSGQALPGEAAFGDHAVATDHPLATLAARQVLEGGGNAADAAVAAAFVVAVVLPSTNSIGGRSQILVREADGTVRVIDGTTQAPRGYDPGRAVRAGSGYATVGVPGALAGLMRLHREHGSVPLEDLMVFAIGHARDGFPLTPQEARFQSRAASDLRRSPGAATSFLRADGSPYEPGELLVQRALAETLSRIAEDGGESFYRGEIARRMSDDIRRHGGYVHVEDLAEYQALDGRVVRGSYRGLELVGAGIPAAGAIAIQALQILENFERSHYTPAVWAAITGQAVMLASQELTGLDGDSASIRATSREWAEAQARHVIHETTLPPPLGSLPDRPSGQARDWLSRVSHTTHLSIADRSGMAVSLTQTVGPVMGARVLTPELGFLYAVTLGGYLGPIEAGERARSFISPMILLNDGEPVMVIGAAGGARIVASVVQVVSRVVDEGLTLDEALRAPRVFMNFGGALEVEVSGASPWSESEMEEVRTLGIDVRPVDTSGAFGLVQALWRDLDSGVWTAVAEPDGEGSAGGISTR